MRCDIFTLCDSAQVADGKLFVLGAGWQHLRSTSLPFSYAFGLAIGILLPSTDLNKEHIFKVNVRPDASSSTLWALDGTFRQSLKRGEPEEDPARLLMATTVNITFEMAGRYSIGLLVDGHELAQTHFRVIAPGI